MAYNKMRSLLRVLSVVAGFVFVYLLFFEVGGAQQTVSPFLYQPFTEDYPITAYFDHRYPNEKGEAGDGNVLIWDGTESSEGDPYWYDGHEGWDYGLPNSTEVLAAASGNAWSEWDDPSCVTCGYGYYARINHDGVGSGFRTIYGHFKPDFQLAPGVHVNRGDVIGLSGHSGNVSGDPGDHLHFGTCRLPSDFDSCWDRVVDPYGWYGTEDDPWHEENDGLFSQWLWADRAAPGCSIDAVSQLSSSEILDLCIPPTPTPGTSPPPGSLQPPILLDPDNNTVVNNRDMIFRWDLSPSNPEVYIFRLVDDPGKIDSGPWLIDEGVDAPTTQVTKHLPDDKTEFWWSVWSCKNTGSGGNCETARAEVRYLRYEDSGPPDGDGVLLCDGENYQNCRLFTEGQYCDLGDFKDRIASVKFSESYVGYYHVVLQTEVGCTGNPYHTRQDVSRLPDGHRDRVRAVNIYRIPSGEYCEGKPNGIYLYSEPYFEGEESPPFTEEVSNLGNYGWDNRAMSIKNCGYCAALYRDVNFQNHKSDVCTDHANLSEHPINTPDPALSSFHLMAWAPEKPVEAIRPQDGSTVVESDEIILEWNEPRFALGYYGEAWNDTVGTLTFGWQPGVTANLQDLPAGTYQWRVKSKNTHQEGEWSDTWTFTVRPATPTHLYIEPSGCSRVNLSWLDNSSSEDGYKIYRNGSYLGQVGADVTRYQDTEISENTTYSYQVKAFRNDLESDSSNTISVLIGVCDLVPPTVSWVSPVGDNQTYEVENEIVQIEVDPADNVGVSYVWFYRWDDVTGEVVDIGKDYSPPYRVSFDTGVLRQEWNPIAVKVFDDADNESTQKTIWLYHTGMSCPDVDGDRWVGVWDVQQYARYWHQAPGAPYDLDRDGAVTVLDIMSAAAKTGTDCLASISSSDVGLIGSMGGASYAVAVKGLYAYLGVGSRMVVLNIFNPNEPVAVGWTAVLSGLVQDITVEGNYAYLAIGTGGLSVVDISNVAHPYQVGYYNTVGNAQAVETVNGLAYVADWAGGVRIIDVANPTAVTEIGHFDTAGSAMDVVVSNSLVYVAESRASADSIAGVRVVSVIDPVHPSEMDFCQTQGDPQGLTIEGDALYVAEQSVWEGGGYVGGGLRVIDVSVPTSPTELSSVIGSANSVTVVDGHAYLAEGQQGLRVFDIGDPAAIVELDSRNTPGYARQIAVAGDYVYVADSRSGMRVINAANLSQLYEVAYYGTIGNVQRAEVVNDHAFVGGAGQLDIIELTPPMYPTEVGSCELSVGTIGGIQVRGNHAYVAGGYGLSIVDISDLTSPTEIGFYPISGIAWDVAVLDEFAYVTGGQESGLRIVQVSDPANPAEVGFFDTQGPAGGVAVAGSHAYISDGYGVYIVDITNPANPTEVSFLETYDPVYGTGDARRIAVAGDYAYVAALYNLLTFDISDPENPVEVSSYELASAWDVDVEGDRLVVAVSRDGFQVFDVSDPSSPRELGVYETAGETDSATILGNGIYVSAGDGGLAIFRIP